MKDTLLATTIPSLNTIQTTPHTAGEDATSDYNHVTQTDTTHHQNNEEDTSQLKTSTGIQTNGIHVQIHDTGGVTKGE
jgi:hypothetical protein